MMYIKNFKQGFITMSPSLKYNASAVFANLNKTLSYYLNKFTEIKKIHINSDSPSA